MNSTQNSDGWETEILDQLDCCAKEYNFPMPNNYNFYSAGMRLKAFRSFSEWLITFEEIHYSKGRSFTNDISAYGNRLEKTGFQQYIEIISEAPKNPMWNKDGEWILDKWNFSVSVQGHLMDFALSQNDYLNAQIGVNSLMPAPVQMLRFLVFIIPEKFFLENRELLYKCGRVDSGLEEFILLDNWHHPDLADDILPSQSLSFRSLAQALAKNERELYTCPQEMLNAHWSHWDLDEPRGWN